MIEVRHAAMAGDWAFQWIESHDRQRWLVCYSGFSHTWQSMVNAFVPTPKGHLDKVITNLPLNWWFV